MLLDGPGGGLVGFEVDLPVEFSPSLLHISVKQRGLVSWALVPVYGVPQLGLRVVDVVGTGCGGGRRPGSAAMSAAVEEGAGVGNLSLLFAN